MLESDAEKFGDELEARWQNTGVAACTRAWELCNGFEFETVVQAMDQLRRAMKSDQLIVDADRLKAVCVQVSQSGPELLTPSERRQAAEQFTAAQRERTAEAKAESEKAFKQVTDAASRADSSLRDEAIRRCKTKYANCWGKYKNQEKLINIELAAMAKGELI